MVSKKLVVSLLFLSVLAAQQAKAKDFVNSTICGQLEDGRLEISLSSTNKSGDLGALLSLIVQATASAVPSDEWGIDPITGASVSRTHYTARKGDWTATRDQESSSSETLSVRIVGRGECQSTPAGFLISGVLALEMAIVAESAYLPLKQNANGQLLLVPNLH